MPRGLYRLKLIKSSINHFVIWTQKRFYSEFLPEVGFCNNLYHRLLMPYEFFCWGIVLLILIMYVTFCVVVVFPRAFAGN